MTDTANAPERIWAIAVEDDQGWFVEVISEDAADPAIDLEYVLATHCDELVAAAYLDAAQRIEQCLWSQHWYIDGESVDPEDLSEDITSRTPDDARAALTAYGERMKADLAEAQAKIARLTEALDLADTALTEAEAILGGEYGDQYQTLCDNMIELRNRIATIQEDAPVDVDPESVIKSQTFENTRLRASIAAAIADAQAVGFAAGVVAAKTIVSLSAWKHGGDDAYSVGMDVGARQQNEQDLAAIRALTPQDATAAAARVLLADDAAAHALCAAFVNGLRERVIDTPPYDGWSQKDRDETAGFMQKGLRAIAGDTP